MVNLFKRVTQLLIQVMRSLLLRMASLVSTAAVSVLGPSECYCMLRWRESSEHYFETFFYSSNSMKISKPQPTSPYSISRFATRRHPKNLGLYFPYFPDDIQHWGWISLTSTFATNPSGSSRETRKARCLHSRRTERCVAHTSNWPIIPLRESTHDWTKNASIHFPHTEKRCKIQRRLLYIYMYQLLPVGSDWFLSHSGVFGCYLPLILHSLHRSASKS